MKRLAHMVLHSRVLTAAGFSVVGAVAAIVAMSLTSCVTTDAPASPLVVHSSVPALQWEALPEFGGAEAVIYRSPDGKRVAAAFRESGSHSFTYPFDEFLYVTSGTAEVSVRGGKTFVLSAGDVAYFEQGATVDFVFSPDFSDVTMLVSDQPVRWR
jgi:uncharacterized cupin superfamily protein